MYSRVELRSMKAGQPQLLPAELVGLALSTLVDLPAALDPVPAQFAGVGFWPVDMAAIEFDQRAQTMTGHFAVTPNVATRRVTAVPELRIMTAGEIAALPPLPEPDPFANFVPLSLLRQRVEKLGMLEPFAAYLGQREALQLKLLTLERGADPAYPEIAAAFDEMDIPQAARDYILAPPSAGAGDPPPMG